MGERNPGRIHVKAVGRAAAAVLSSARLTAAAVFERSFYLEDALGRMACILWPGAESGPLHAVCRTWISPARCGIEPGTILASENHVLTAPGAVFQLCGAASWTPPPFPTFSRRKILSGLRDLRETLRSGAPKHTLLARICFPASGDAEAKTPIDDTVLEFIRDASANLSKALQNRSDSSGAVQSLLGLGPGLTPSGDDILAGALLALHAVKDSAGLSRLRDEVAAVPKSATNRISWAHLHAAAEGEGAEVFHSFLGDLLQGGRPMENYFHRVDAIGHTSGWDILFGICLVLDAAFPDKKRLVGTIF